MSFIPVTPGGSICADLESDTEDEAWTALMKAAAHMPYPNKQAFIDRGYTVEEAFNNKSTGYKIKKK